MPRRNAGGMNWECMLKKAAGTAGITAAAAYFMGETQTASLFGLDMPAYAAVGVAGGAGSMAADVLEEEVLGLKGKMGELEGAAISAGIAGATTMLILGAHDGGRPGTAFAIGAASAAGSEYLFGKGGLLY